MPGSQDLELGDLSQSNRQTNTNNDNQLGASLLESRSPSPSPNSGPDSRREIPQARAQGNSTQENGSVQKGKHVPSLKKMWKVASSFVLDEKPYRVKERWGVISWNILKRVIIATVLASAMVLGVIGQTFNTEFWLWHGLWVSQDAQLAAFGLFNTILYYSVFDSLCHIAGTTVTRWMVKKNDRGASTLDFEMEDELRKPWKAITNCYKRSKSNDWSWRDFLRFIPVFIIGLCMVLLNAAMNTVAIPQD